MIYRDADDYTEIAGRAVRGGYRDIVLDMIDRDANNYNQIASVARGGHLDIVPKIRKIMRNAQR